MKAIVLSASSDIGIKLIKSLNEKGYEVFGTYKNTFPDENVIKPDNLLKLDIKDFDSRNFIDWLNKIGEWDLFISCIGTQEPIGFLNEVHSREWVEGVSANSVYQIGALINALKFRNKKITPSVIFFAGGGTNSATPAYSAQNLGKITLIKTVEMLNDEIDDTKFIILGPGWVKTKIHNSTLLAKEKAGQNYKKTIFMLESGKLNSIEKVIKDIFILISLPKYLVSGRNFSSVHDDLNLSKLKDLYEENKDFYKLRRNLNNY